MRKLILSASLAALSVATLVTAPAVLAQAPAAAAHYSTSETDIGTLIDNPATRAVIDKWAPGFSTNPQIDMARSMTMKSVQQYAPDKLPDDVLAKIDADLAKIPVAK